MSENWLCWFPPHTSPKYRHSHLSTCYGIDNGHINDIASIIQFQHLPGSVSDQLHFMPLLPLTKDREVVHVYVLIDLGTIHSFVTGKVSKYIILPSREGTKLNNHYPSTTETMIFSKTSLYVSPCRDSTTSYYIPTLYATSLRNVPTVTYEPFGKTCQQYSLLQHNSFPAFQNGLEEFMLRVNHFAVTYPIKVLNGNCNEPFSPSLRASQNFLH